MLIKKIFKLIIVGSVGFSAAVSAELDYTCPESNEIQAIIKESIEQGKTKIQVYTRFGVLQAELPTNTGDFDNLAFDYASLLYSKGNAVPYEIACSYKMPNITFYTYSKNAANPTLYMGLSPFWVTQNSSYAACTYSAKYCIFKEKTND